MSDATDDAGVNQHESVPEVLAEIVKKREQARKRRLHGVKPDTDEEILVGAYERGLKEAIRAFESLREFEKLTAFPEWQIGLENDSGEWDWFYPHALSRESAIEKAKEKARDSLGDGPLEVYEVGGPVAE